MTFTNTSFEMAAAYLSNAPSLAKVSNSVKLELYGLFKYITVSPSPTTSRPSIFDMTGRAKWDAWSVAGTKYSSTREAESRYLELARELGWDETSSQDLNELPGQSEGKGKGKGKERKQETTDEEGDIWDSEEDSAGGKGSGGLGLSVSTMAYEKEPSERNLHGFAVENDTEGVKDLLSLTPDLNLNESDEHGYTPLHLAADRGHPEMVNLLLSRGVDKDIRDPDGYTALELARIAGHEGVVSALSNEHNQ